MVRFAGYARKREPRWPYVAMALVILMAAAVVLFIFSAVAQWLEAEANKPVTTTTTTVSTTVATTTIAPIVTTTSLPPIVSATGIKVDQIVIASGIDDAKQPVDDLAKIPAGKFSKIYCYTRMSNAGKPQAIRHVWIGPGGKALAEIELAARGGASATWSYINIAGQRGQWQVRVETKDGAVLAKRIFVTF
jgi:hypothetical protein